MRIAAIPGSYDPVTAGHVDIIRRAARLYDRVYVVAMVNVDKTYLFSPSERVELLKEALAGLGHVIVEYESGFFYQYARDRGVEAVVKGVRTREDFTYEREIARFNRQHYPGAETLLMPADDSLAHVSSSQVKRMVAQGQDVTGLVTENCLERLKEKLL